MSLFLPNLIRTRRAALALVSTGALCLLSACAATGTSVSDFDQVTLAPGDTGHCDCNPCRVSLQMPPGTGSYEVRGNEVKIGSYPAGQVADLGSFWQTQAFEIKGANVAKAYAYIPQQR
jgi:hypothetical protein